MYTWHCTWRTLQAVTTRMWTFHWSGTLKVTCRKARHHEQQGVLRVVLHDADGRRGVTATTPGGGECDPYSKPPPNAANVNLTTLLTRFPTNAANVNLCEEMT